MPRPDATLVESLQLNPEEWRVVGEPVPIVDSVTGQVPPTRSKTTYTLTLSGPGGATKVVTMAPSPGQPGIDAGNVTVGQLDFSPTDVKDVAKPAETAAEANAAIEKAKAEKAAADAQAATAQANLDKIKTDNAKRDANVASRGLWMTDQEIADMDAKLRDQGLTQQQIDNQLKIASDNNAISRTSNEIAATNARTTAFTAQKNAEIAEARIRFEQTGLDEQIAQNTFTRAQAEIANRLAQDKLELDRLTQQQANEIASRSAKVAEEQNVIRREEAAQTAQTAALSSGATAAAQVYGAERTAQQQAAQTGQDVLQQRATSFQELSQAPFTQAAALSQGSAGRYGMLGGGLQAMPAAGTVGNIMQGAMGVSGQLAGGQNALQAAAAAIENVKPGAALTPQGQAALGVLTQMFERTNAILQGGKVKAPVTTPGAAAVTPAATPAAAALTAPTTYTPAQQLANQATAGQQTAQATNQFNALGGGLGPIAANPMLNAMQSFQSPVTAPAPTININV